MLQRKLPLWLLLVLSAAVLVGGIYCVHISIGAPMSAQVSGIEYQTSFEADPSVRFDMEAYDLIQKHYWLQPDKYTLPDLFRRSIEKLTGRPQTLSSNDRLGTALLVAQALAHATSTAARGALATNMLRVVTYNLLPLGRSALYTAADTVALRQNVSNVKPDSDLYHTLGLPAGSSPTAVEKAFKEQTARLAAATTTVAESERKALAYAHQVLSDSSQKLLYDTAKIEPTASSKVMGHTLYIRMDKISPTTLGEFGRSVDAASTTPSLESMIIDLRGNVGGTLDFLNYFLGLYIGPNQYAFDLFHQGTLTAERTTAQAYAPLGRYTELVFLTDGQTQSTAELTASAFRHLKLAKIVGTKTRGWGTIENTFPISTEIEPGHSYSLFLVSYLTVREDSLPIQDNGVIPDVDISKDGWQTELSQKVSSQSLRAAVRTVVSTAPVR